MMWPSLHQPLDSFAVRWRQRSRKAAGWPVASRNSMMFSPSSVNGFGPASSLSIGSVAYQNRRRTLCLVQSMAFLRLMHEPFHHAGRIASQSFEVEAGDRAVLDHDLAADHEQLEVGCARAGDRPDQGIVEAEIAWAREIEHRYVGELARRQHADVIESEHAGAIDGRPPHHILHRGRGGALG